MCYVFSIMQNVLVAKTKEIEIVSRGIKQNKYILHLQEASHPN